MDITGDVSQEQFDGADLEQRRRWRARAWLVKSRIGPNYPHHREPVYADLRGPEQAEVEQAGRLQLGITSAEDAQQLAKQQVAKQKQAQKRKKAA